MDFLLGVLRVHLEVLVSCLSVGKGGPWSQEEVVIEDFEFGEVTVIDDLGMLEMGVGR